MTNIEVIKALKRLFSTYELDLPGTDSLEVLHKSIDALEKQIAKNPTIMKAISKKQTFNESGFVNKLNR